VGSQAPAQKDCHHSMSQHPIEELQ